MFDIKNTSPTKYAKDGSAGDDVTREEGVLDWRDLVFTSIDNSDYYKSEIYNLERAEFMIKMKDHE